MMTNSDALERWKLVPGYANRYEASDRGRVRRISGQGASPNAPRYLKTFTCKLGYVRIPLVMDGRIHKPGLHVIIAKTFLGPCPENHEVNHIDLNKMNNHVSNLEYVTKMENQRHARRNREWKKDYSRRRLTPAQVADIRASNLPQRTLGARYGISGSAIWRIRHYKDYKELP